MRRLTVTVDESLLNLAKADVAAGRAESISAWVADAMRAKAQARAELVADLEDLEGRDATPKEVIWAIARTLGRSRAWVVHALGLPQSRPRRAG